MPLMAYKSFGSEGDMMMSLNVVPSFKGVRTMLSYCKVCCGRVVKRFSKEK